MDQLITIKTAKLGPVSNFTAYIYIYICSHMYVIDRSKNMCIYTYIYISSKCGKTCQKWLALFPSFIVKMPLQKSVKI